MVRLGEINIAKNLRPLEALLLRSRGISYKFPAALIGQAEQCSLPPAELAARPQVLGITISSGKITEIEPGFTIQKINGEFNFALSVPDVTEVIKPRSLIDDEARLRCSSLHLKNIYRPLLPNCLIGRGSGTVNFILDQPRLALTIEVAFDRFNQPKESRIFKSVFINRAALTFGQADDILMNQSDSELGRTLGYLSFLARAIYKNFEQNESFFYYNFDHRSMIDEEGNPISSNLSKFHAYFMVKQFEILANLMAAEFLLAHNSPVLFRVQTAGAKIHFREKFIRKLKEGLDCQKFWQIKNMIRENGFLAFYSTRNAGHFGLNAEAYTHFVSPLKNYPDIAAQRLVKSALEGTPVSPAELLDLEKLGSGYVSCLTLEINTYGEIIKSRDEGGGLSGGEGFITEKELLDLTDREFSALINYFATENTIYIPDLILNAAFKRKLLPGDLAVLTIVSARIPDVKTKLKNYISQNPLEIGPASSASEIILVKLMLKEGLLDASAAAVSNLLAQEEKLNYITLLYNLFVSKTSEGWKKLEFIPSSAVFNDQRILHGMTASIIIGGKKYAVAAEGKKLIDCRRAAAKLLYEKLVEKGIIG